MGLIISMRFLFHIMNKDLSIVVPSYNEENNIQKCIKAIKAQKGNFSYEIIVVDNNSNDKTKKKSEEMGVKVICEKTQGVGSARRTGTNRAIGKFVLHLDADSILPPSFFIQLMSYFKNNSDVVCVGGQYIFYDAPWWKNLLRFILFYPLLYFARIVTNFRVGPMGGCMAFRRDIYLKTQGFRKDLKFGEDSEICRQLSYFGKIKVNTKLKCFTSSRRFKINFKLLVLFFQFLKLVFNRRYNYNFPHSDEL